MKGRQQILAGLLGLALVIQTATAADNPVVVQLNQRLAALQADPDLAELAAYEKLQAQHAVAAFSKARRSQRETAQYVAERRVQIAEIAARTQAARREADRLDRTRSELLVEASRREAERARREAERLRVQAQIQAEEAERLRLAAEAEALARQEAETTLDTVAGQQANRLSAARQRELKLAREEAELVSGAKLPASRFEARGEVFTLGADAFASDSAALSASGASRASALAAYLQANPKARARIDGYGDKQTPGQRRADALRDALTAAGIAKSRLQSSGKGTGSKARALEVVVTH
ncbi:OmpA family protein [Pseudoxanthomonas sp. F37]|uniref:OmpA family protein n=1 Tax=Pseudoxanthomonas TaxID=83618 RepID=UPI001FD48E77|nr:MULTISPECIES: OmpA family protein [Pseudoxanthomonas]UOV06593.1 OmpA family protein [Pseudoxanthomonas mexicana]UOV08200.1 OmpA family protein [Pseudoxanthomonas sp. F37]